jgi:hypothetical protein
MFIPKYKSDRKSEFVFEGQIVIFALSQMKKLAAFSLLAVFLFNSVGYYVVFNISRAQVKKEVKTRMKQAIPDQELTVIEFRKDALSGIRWEKENKEFFYSDKLFDIVKKEETASSVIFYCIDDKKEKQLFASLEKFIDIFIAENENEDEDSDKKSSKKLNDHKIKVYYSTDFNFVFHYPPGQASFYFTSKNYLTELSEIQSPPPEVNS